MSNQEAGADQQLQADQLARNEIRVRFSDQVQVALIHDTNDAVVGEEERDDNKVEDMGQQTDDNSTGFDNLTMGELQLTAEDWTGIDNTMLDQSGDKLDDNLADITGSGTAMRLKEEIADNSVGIQSLMNLEKENGVSQDSRVVLGEASAVGSPDMVTNTLVDDNNPTPVGHNLEAISRQSSEDVDVEEMSENGFAATCHRLTSAYPEMTSTCPEITSACSEDISTWPKMTSDCPEVTSALSELPSPYQEMISVSSKATSDSFGMTSDVFEMLIVCPVGDGKLEAALDLNQDLGRADEVADENAGHPSANFGYDINEDLQDKIAPKENTHVKAVEADKEDQLTAADSGIGAVDEEADAIDKMTAASSCEIKANVEPVKSKEGYPVHGNLLAFHMETGGKENKGGEENKGHHHVADSKKHIENHVNALILSHMADHVSNHVNISNHVTKQVTNHVANHVVDNHVDVDVHAEEEEELVDVETIANLDEDVDLLILKVFIFNSF